ncbi:mRNA decay activator protein ZFP36L1 [Pholidichthys leucotaenia]
MPSYPMNHFVNLDEMMCKHLLNLDLREPDRLPPSLSLMRAPGCIGEPCRNTSPTSSSLPRLPTEPSDSMFVTSNQWGQRSESNLPSQFEASSQWERSGFFSQRSLSMVEETSTTSGTSLGRLMTRNGSQSDINSTALNTSASSSRYKTELCRSFTENGLCKYGGKCQFAHGPEELRDLNRHPKYKTEPCRTFHTIGFCPYGIRCHFIHNSEEEKPFSCSSSSFSSSSNIAHHSSSSFLRRPPLLRQSFSFSGFPSASQRSFQPAPADIAASGCSMHAPSASPASCADITDLLSHAFLELDSAFEASPAYGYLVGQATTVDPLSPVLPSHDSGYSPCGISPAASSDLGESPCTAGVHSGPLGVRSLSSTSLSDQDKDGSSTASSLSGSESCGGITEGSNRRLAVFSQLSVPDDATGPCL